VNAKSLWSSTAAEYSDVIREAYPAGNGRPGGLVLSLTYCVCSNEQQQCLLEKLGGRKSI